MCGITGIINARRSPAELMEKVRRMCQSIHYRGPDGDGIYQDELTPSLVLGHRRLAIIDPEHGKQPMTTLDGRYTIVFNGAVYNYLELRRELVNAGLPIHSYSDTEVILYAYAHWGESCVSRFHGMFAFAIWDKQERKLFCARDRIGIKPFYFYCRDNTFVFASEIKAILASEEVARSANYQALQDYIAFQFCLNDKTLFKDISKLEPGYTLTVRVNTSDIRVVTKQYWDVSYTIDDTHDEAYFVDKLAFLLEDSVSQHLRSDVPLGAHLSGGLDSSAVAGFAAGILDNSPLTTFTGAFREGKEYDETFFAKHMASHINAQYQEVFIPSHEFTSLLPKLVYHMDEPAAGPGIIPQYYVSQLAAQHVKVVLGGQGGDELYIGYARYLVAYLEQCLAGAIDNSAGNQEHIASLMQMIPNLLTLKTYKPMLQHLWKRDLFGPADSRYFRLIDRSEGSQELYNPELFQNYSSFAEFQSIFNRQNLSSCINKMTYFDLKASLPALLQVEDRTSMANSIESRVPLLEHRLIEFMASIPPSIKFAGGKTKHLFRQAIKHVIPKEILERKDKMGFPVPLNDWLGGHSQSFVKDILFSTAAKERGIYDMKQIEASLSNRAQFSRVIWGLLNIELWHQIFIDETFVI